MRLKARFFLFLSHFLFYRFPRDADLKALEV